MRPLVGTVPTHNLNQFKRSTIQLLENTLRIIHPGDLPHLGQAFTTAIVLKRRLSSPRIVDVDERVMQVGSFGYFFDFVDEVREEVVEVGVIGCRFVGGGYQVG